MQEFIPTLGNLIEEIDKILATIPKSTYPDYAKTFKDTLTERVIFSGVSFEEWASEYCHEVGTKMNHRSDCAIYNEPAYPRGRCDCGLLLTPIEISEIIDSNYDADPWECAKASVEDAIQMQFNRSLR